MESPETGASARGRKTAEERQLIRRLRPVTHRCYLIVYLFLAIIACILVLIHV